MDVIFTKVLSLIGILLFSVLFGIAPIVFKRCVRSPKVQWINNAIICFSGGTLLGISFLHLMPEMRGSVNNLMLKGHFSSFPHQISISDTIICGGFFFIYILDELIHTLLECAGEDHRHQPHGGRLSMVNSYGDSLKSKKDEVTPVDSAQIEEWPYAPPNSTAAHIPGILTIIALSFHDVFEGLALGIQEHNMDVLFLFLSVATHKYAIAFSVSLDFLLSGVCNKMIVIYTLCFSLVNPIGIALGIFTVMFHEDGNIESPVTVLMQGVASGSLIYVVCFEVLQRHGSGNGGHVTGIRNTLFVILGYVIVVIMKMLMPHDHLHVEPEGH